MSNSVALDNNEIIEKIKAATNLLFLKDYYLLEHDLSERSITHKLAGYLQDSFNEYNVDCEYNGSTFTLNERKCISLIKEKLREIGKKFNPDATVLTIFPDIIVHNRGNKNCNILVIELKKNLSNSKAKKFDIYKLERYTSDELKYQLGAFIEVLTKNKKRKYRISFFENGGLKNSETIILPNLN